MSNLIDEKRTYQIITFINSLNIKSKRFYEIVNSRNQLIIQNFNEALTHSSGDTINNYEKLEFFGDAVLRLAASNFIQKKYINMSVGNRSELRSQIVSDEWLTKLGQQINIEKVIIKGQKAIGDENSKNTIIAEATEALIGALYKCFNSIKEVNLFFGAKLSKYNAAITPSGNEMIKHTIMLYNDPTIAAATPANSGSLESPLEKSVQLNLVFKFPSASNFSNQPIC